MSNFPSGMTRVMRSSVVCFCLLPLGNLSGGVASISIDPTLFAGNGAHMVIDSENRPHISHVVGSILEGEYELRYATWAPDGGWQNTTIYEFADSPGALTAETSIGLDSNGNPHVLFYSKPDSESDPTAMLQHITSDHGNWNVETIDHFANPFVRDIFIDGLRVDIFVDTDDSLHSVYSGDRGLPLTYATRQGDTWDQQSTISGDRRAWYSSGVIDEGRIHVVFTVRPELGDVETWYGAREPDGMWNTELLFTADPTTVGLNRTDIAIDREGNPAVVFNREGEGVNLARKTGENWSFERVRDFDTRRVLTAC